MGMTTLGSPRPRGGKLGNSPLLLPPLLPTFEDYGPGTVRIPVPERPCRAEMCRVRERHSGLFQFELFIFSHSSVRGQGGCAEGLAAATKPPAKVGPGAFMTPRVQQNAVHGD